MHTLSMTREEQLRVIRQYVREEREKRGIHHLKRDRPLALSGEMYGEFYELVERQLMLTEDGCGAWIELENPEVLEGAYRYVAAGQRS